REHSLLLRAADKLLWRWRFQQSAPAEDWQLVAALYRTMRGEHPKAGFVVAADHRALEASVGADPRFRYVPLQGLLAEGRGAFIFPIDTHWNAAGHARVAEAIDTAIAAELAARGPR